MIAPVFGGLALLVTIWLLLWAVTGWRQGMSYRICLGFGVAAAVAAVDRGGYDGLAMAAIALVHVWIAATKYTRSRLSRDPGVKVGSETRP